MISSLWHGDLARREFFLYQAGTVAVCWGRAWQHLWHDTPYRAMLWHEQWMRPLLEWMGISWHWWVGSPQVDYGIDMAIRIGGLWFFVAGGVALFAKRLMHHPLRHVLCGAVVLLVALAGMEWLEHWRHAAQWFEYSLQIAFPLSLWYLMGMEQSIPWATWARLMQWLKVAVAFTFAAHGLYALGVYPVPSDFVKMTVQILPLTVAQAHQFLMMAGLMDWVVAIGLFLPFGKWRHYLLCYAALWGVLTALARPVAWVDAIDLWRDLSLYLPMMIWRLPHAFGPFALWLWERHSVVPLYEVQVDIDSHDSQKGQS